eukprot:3049795-Amphidinium_carterae.1
MNTGTRLASPKTLQLRGYNPTHQTSKNVGLNPESISNIIYPTLNARRSQTLKCQVLHYNPKT